MTYLLVIWTVVGLAYAPGVRIKEYDWRPMASFSSAAVCRSAAAQMGIPPERYRCISQNTEGNQ